MTSIQIDRGLVFATSKMGRHWTRHTTLAELGPLLGAGPFIRVHRRSLVNVTSVLDLIVRPSRTAYVRLSCGTEVQVSRSRARAVRAQLGR